LRKSGYLILFFSLVIAAVGILTIYSSTSQREDRLWQDFYRRQALWVLLGLTVFFLVCRLNYRLFVDLGYFFYLATLTLLFLVFLLGVTRLGAQRWLHLVWFNFQPSEFAKLATIIFLARYFSKKSAYDISLSSSSFGMLRGVIIPFIFVAIPAALIVQQPDLGSGLMLLFMFIAMLYLTPVRQKYLFIFLLILAICVPFSWCFLRDYQRERLSVFLNPNADPLGAGYTVIQSKIAIGSGWLWGKGWLSGTQSQLRFLPESHTDFIFATFAEEWGFLGCCVLLSLYLLLVRQGILIAQRTNDLFGKLLAYGITFMLGIQIFINIAMNLGIAPVVGLPLPLMSYGGSSVVITFAALGILANIDRAGGVF
jgi:rod shape determining protein RodA